MDCTLSERTACHGRYRAAATSDQPASQTLQTSSVSLYLQLIPLGLYSLLNAALKGRLYNKHMITFTVTADLLQDYCKPIENTDSDISLSKLFSISVIQCDRRVQVDARTVHNMTK